LADGFRPDFEAAIIFAREFCARRCWDSDLHAFEAAGRGGDVETNEAVEFVFSWLFRAEEDLSFISPDDVLVPVLSAERFRDVKYLY